MAHGLFPPRVVESESDSVRYDQGQQAEVLMASKMVTAFLIQCNGSWRRYDDVLQ